MAYNRIQVRAFLSASEIDLFESSLGATSKALGTADLRRRLQRTRTLRDKSRDLLQRQRLATRTRTGNKGGTSGVANERTAKKVTAFEEMLKRFEAEANAREASTNKSPAKRASSGKASAPSSSRPAAVVLREALDKKEAAREGDASDITSAGGAKAPTRSNAKAPTGGVQATGPSTRARAVASRLADSNLSHIQGHTSTQVRRSQAKRDQKG